MKLSDLRYINVNTVGLDNKTEEYWRKVDLFHPR